MMATHTPRASALSRKALARPQSPSADLDESSWREAPLSTRQPDEDGRADAVLLAPLAGMLAQAAPAAPPTEEDKAEEETSTAPAPDSVPFLSDTPAASAPTVDEWSAPAAAGPDDWGEVGDYSPDGWSSGTSTLASVAERDTGAGTDTDGDAAPPPPAPAPATEGAAVETAAAAETAAVAETAALAEGAAALEGRDIRKSLPLGKERIDILKGISLRIEPGELVAIVGPSGSGKSTLLGIIAGLDSPTSGQVLVDGVDITHMSEGQLASVRNQKIGMVYQAFNLIPNLTAQENVEVPLYVGKHPGSPAERAREQLVLVGLRHRLGNRPSQLSGGEQQRVAIARALATNPTIVIMDEPTGNLDQKNSENVLRTIRDLRERTGKTFIIATHDPNVAGAADRAIRIVDGQIADG
jgi:putative ABC transport system ATP-binding protein